MRSRGKLPRIVATRVFRTVDARDVKAIITEPVKTQIDEWKCEFRISGLQRPVVDCSRGLDSLQALALALEGVRAHIEAAGEALTWLDGELGDLGIPHTIPSTYGHAVEKHLLRLINDEVERLIKERRARTGAIAPDKE